MYTVYSRKFSPRQNFSLFRHCMEWANFFYVNFSPARPTHFFLEGTRAVGEIKISDLFVPIQSMSPGRNFHPANFCAIRYVGILRHHLCMPEVIDYYCHWLIFFFFNNMITSFSKLSLIEFYSFSEYTTSHAQFEFRNG